MILIIAAEDDAHVPYVTGKLDALGAEYLRFDPQDFPAAAAVSAQYRRDGTRRLFLDYQQASYDLARVRAVWNRARVRPVPGADVRSDHSWWVGECCSRFISEFYECVDCLWLPERPNSDREPFRIYNPTDRTGAANPTRARWASPYNKLHQLEMAGRLGFRIPSTLITNDPDRALAFYERCNGDVISKRAAHLVNYRDGEMAIAYTTPVERRDVGRFPAIRHAPVIFQEKIPKKVELRVTVVGAKVFTAEIRSQDRARLQNDWRHSVEFGAETHHAVHDLPEAIARQCVALVVALGLCFAALDLILTPDGDYVFLECNPNGQWASIEEYVGLPISDAIAELLISGKVAETSSVHRPADAARG